MFTLVYRRPGVGSPEADEVDSGFYPFGIREMRSN